MNMQENLPKPQNHFQKIVEKSDIEKIIRDLVFHRVELSCKILDPGAEVFKIICHSYATRPSPNGALEFICRLSPGHGMVSIGQPLESQGKLITTFTLGPDKYFAQISFETKEEDILVVSVDPLCRIQRRDSFRIPIPASYGARFEVQRKNELPFIQTMIIEDLSAGGTRIKIPSAGKIAPPAEGLDLSGGDLLEGVIALPGRQPFEIQGLVKHLQKNSWAGISFVNISEKDKNRVSSIVMDLYKEFYLSRA